MVNLSRIIEHIETIFGIKISGNIPMNRRIDSVKFLTDDTLSQTAEGILYIGRCGQEPPQRRCMTVLVTGMREPPSDEWMMWTDAEPDQTELFNAVQDVLRRGIDMEMKKALLFQSLHSNNGIVGLANVAHEVLNNPVTICDSSFSILSASPMMRDMKNLVEHRGKLYLKEAKSQDMVDRKIIEHIYSSTEPYITELPDYTYKWVFQAIRIRHSVVGYICVRGTIREFTDEDMEFLVVLSQMLSIEMQKDSTFSYPTGLKYEYFLTELLGGRIDRTDYIINHFIQLGKAQTPYYAVMVIRFDGEQVPFYSTKGYFNHILTILPNSMVVLYGGDITALLPSNTMDIFTEDERSRLKSFLNMNRMKAYVSYPFTELEKASLYYNQAKGMSKAYKRVSEDGEKIVKYQEYFLEHLLNLIPDTSLIKAAIHPDILRVSRYDREGGTEYAKTLMLYLKKSRSAPATAQALHLHKSTLFYRFNKMKELFGIDLTDESKLFAYEFSFRALEYLMGNPCGNEHIVTNNCP